MSLKHEPSSEQLHIYVKQIVTEPAQKLPCPVHGRTRDSLLETWYGGYASLSWESHAVLIVFGIKINYTNASKSTHFVQSQLVVFYFSF